MYVYAHVCMLEYVCVLCFLFFWIERLSASSFNSASFVFTYVCMYVCMYACLNMYVCYVCFFLSLYECICEIFSWASIVGPGASMGTVSHRSSCMYVCLCVCTHRICHAYLMYVWYICMRDIQLCLHRAFYRQHFEQCFVCLFVLVYVCVCVCACVCACAWLYVWERKRERTRELNKLRGSNCASWNPAGVEPVHWKLAHTLKRALYTQHSKEPYVHNTQKSPIFICTYTGN